MTVPFVRIVVLNYDGGDMTVRCLDSLRRLTWPADRREVVLVDNASVDGLVEHLPASHPEVRVIESLVNTGFAGGCNLGINAPGDYDYVVLFNNDAIPEPGWLEPLAAALDADPGLGAACSKMVLMGRYLGVTVRTSAAPPPGGRDDRNLGVRLSGVQVDGEPAWHQAAFDEGFWPPEPGQSGEPGMRWSKATGDVRVRVDTRPADAAPPRTMALRVSALTERSVELDSGAGGETVTVTVGPEPQWVTVTLPSTPHDVINSAGSALYVGGYGGDRGFLERDRGQYDEPAEVFSFCGGAVMFRRAFLDQVGLLDERFFIYYEDTDLAWRGRQAGWRYRYVPTSVVRHDHSATSGGESSEIFRFHVERNRLLLLAKNAPASMAARALGVELKIAWGTLRREVLAPVRHLHRPHPLVTKQKARSLKSYATLLPAMLRDRRRLARTRVVGHDDLPRWILSK